MKIAVLSGKGGTGKTLVSVNLAAVAKAASYLDCDVEEPNGHLFFKPTDVEETEVNVKIALVDQELCNGCRKCVEFCKFNALAYVKDRLIIFEDVCHSCGGCMLVCPQQALTEKNKPIGKIQSGRSDRVQVNSGILNTGEATGIPLINKLLEDNKENAADLTLIDCPPGSACIVMESIKDADYCILLPNRPCLVYTISIWYTNWSTYSTNLGAVLNKCQADDNPAEAFCKKNNIKILARIPVDRELGTLNSNGKIASREWEKYRALFTDLLETVVEEVKA